MQRGDWTRRQIADGRARAEARDELEHGFRGPISDEDMVRYARASRLVYGPAPLEDWGSYEPNTWSGT